MLNWLKKNKILIKLKAEQKQAFLNAWSQYESCLKMEQQLSPEYSRSFSEAYFGIAYEFFILDLIDEGLEVLKKVHKSRYVDFIHRLDEPIHLVVFTVVYSNMKESKKFEDDYFFQSMEGQLLLNPPKFPENTNFHFEKFITSWQKVFGELKVSEIVGEIDMKTGQATMVKKYSKK